MVYRNEARKTKRCQHEDQREIPKSGGQGTKDAERRTPEGSLPGSGRSPRPLPPSLRATRTERRTTRAGPLLRQLRLCGPRPRRRTDLVDLCKYAEVPGLPCMRQRVRALSQLPRQAMSRGSRHSARAAGRQYPLHPADQGQVRHRGRWRLRVAQPV